jgi:hypothetical protein
MSTCSKMAAFMLGCFLAYYSNLRMEAIYSAEATIDLSRITRCYRPEDKLFMAISAITSV